MKHLIYLLPLLISVALAASCEDGGGDENCELDVETCTAYYNSTTFEKIEDDPEKS